MTDQPKSKELAVSNYDRIKAMANDPKTIQRFADVLGSKTEGRGYIASAMLAVKNSPALQECTPSSLFNSIMRAATLRLECDPALRQAHLVPFKNHEKNIVNATLILGYIGIQNLALRTGKYEICNPGRLYEGEEMVTDRLTGVCRLDGSAKSKTVTAYFHYFKLTSGYTHVFVMTVEELREHGKRYAPKNPMWKDRFDDMCMKTVTRLNLLKFGILDPHDKTIIGTMVEEKDPDAEPVQSDIIDGEFTEADDLEAEEKAKQIAKEKANAPKKSDAQLLEEMGFGKPEKPTSVYPVHADPAPTQADPKPITQVISNMTLEVARAIPYQDKPLDALTDNQLLDLVTTENDKKAANQKYNPMVLQAAGIILSHRLGQ